MKAYKGLLSFFGVTTIGLALHCGTDGDISEFPPSNATAACKALADCGKTCEAAESCAAGLYCDDTKHCNADCAPGVEPACGAGLICDSVGRCTENGGGPDLPPVGDGGPVNPGGDGGVCADVQLTLEKVIPTVTIFLDMSSSMDQQLVAGKTRLQAAKDALIGEATGGGVIKELEGDVAIGLTIFSFDSPNERTGLDAKYSAACPYIEEYAPAATSSYAAIDGKLRTAASIEDTPTPEALLKFVGIDKDGAPLGGGYLDVKSQGPKVILLATDGEPHLCSKIDDDTEPSINEARAAVVDAVTKIKEKGIKTYALAVGTGVGEEHLQAVATAGGGTAVTATNVADLKTAFRSIIAAQRSCIFALNGEVPAGKEALGKVSIDGAPLTLNDANGWRLNTSKELEFLGTACDTIKNTSAPVISVIFPCGAGVIKTPTK